MGSSILGAAVKRVEDPRFITGRGDYITNMPIEGALWMVPVRSPVAHGLLLGVDADLAASAHDVVAVYTAADLDLGHMPTDAPGQPESTRRPVIASDRVRYVGDIVAVVVARSERAAVDAAGLVWPDIDPLPTVASPEAALAEGAPLLFPEHGSNRVLGGGIEPESDPLAGAEVVIRQRIVHQRLAAVPLEPNAAAAIPGPNGSLEIWVASQNVFLHRNVISRVLGVDRSLLRVRVPDMGGGFGAKISVYPEQALVAALALRLGRPVRWHERRSENMVAMTHGRAQIHDAAMGARRDGTITGLKIDALQDAGAYPLTGAYLPNFTQRMAGGPYRIPAVEFRWQSVVTNTTPTHAYRGAGRPEATGTLERMVDLLAHELGMDPVEIRRRNLIGPDEFPFVSATGERYDSGNYQAALKLALERADYDALRGEQSRRRASGDPVQLGIGVSTYVEITAPENRKEWGQVEIHADGSATAYSGSSAHGQGHETTFAQLASEILHIPVERIRVVQGDSRRVSRGTGTMGSRSLQLGGTALARAGDAVIDKARQVIAHHTGIDLADIEFLADGRFALIGDRATAWSWAEVSQQARERVPEGMDIGLCAEDLWVQEDASVPFGAHIAVVEVDTETGDVRLRKHVACDDCGTILNRVVVDGQVHGGVAQGVGAALFEGVLYDSEANPITGNLTTYLIPTASSLPMIDIDHTQTPTDQNTLGAKGIGESGTIGATPAVVSAVHDALSGFGVRHLDMPFTAAKVWAALADGSH